VGLDPRFHRGEEMMNVSIKEGLTRGKTGGGKGWNVAKGKKIYRERKSIETTTRKQKKEKRGLISRKQERVVCTC